MTQPVDHITAAFNQGRPAFIPYFTIGYPDFDTSLDVIEACVNNGADIVELGMPFSDPLADGPTIQGSTQVALKNGITIPKCVEAVKSLRARGVDAPLVLFGYFNPLLNYGLENIVRDAKAAGASGFVIPDLPPEEADDMDAICREHGMALIYLLAPTSTDDRMELVAEKATGFTYLVSVTGITGARTGLSDTLGEYVERVRGFVTKTPVAVGFGISTPEQAAKVGTIADGVVIGSKLVKLAGAAEDPAAEVGAFVKSVVDALS